jgi:hypothetical protein
MYIHYNSHWVLHMFPSYHWWSAECDIFMIGETQPGPSAETEPSWSSPRPSGHTFWLWSWNLQTSLFLACSWPHLLLKLLFSLCYVLSTTEKLLHCLTSTGFNFWLHLFLGANTPETCSVGAQVQTFFLMLSVTHLLHGLRFLQLHTASGEKHQCGCMKFTSRILHAFTWMLVTHQHLWFSSLPHFVFFFYSLAWAIDLDLDVGTPSGHNFIPTCSPDSAFCDWRHLTPQPSLFLGHTKACPGLLFFFVWLQSGACVAWRKEYHHDGRHLHHSLTRTPCHLIFCSNLPSVPP